jgi:hypothetical protein
MSKFEAVTGESLHQSPSDVKKNPLSGPRGKGGYYEKLMEVIFLVG